MFSKGVDSLDRTQDDPVHCMPGLTAGLSGRLLLLTVIFVMIAEVLIFVPSVANMRLSWLQDRLNTAAAAGAVIDGLQAELPRSVQNDTLMATGAKLIALRKDGTSRLLAVAETPPGVDEQYDLSDVSQVAAVRDAFSTLLFGGNRVIRVFDVVGDSDTIIELVLGENKLRAAMLAYARNVFLISIVLSLITAGLIFISINRIMIRPIRRLTLGMQNFSEDPGNPERIFVPEEGTDELSVAGRHLADMQTELQKTLRQQKNLVDLGLAVSKINHDMRNILSSAQLMSDRLVDAKDPMVRSFAPKLLRTIDRAVAYTGEVLAYGQATEGAPKRKMVQLSLLVRDVRDILALDPDSGIEFHDSVPRISRSMRIPNSFSGSSIISVAMPSRLCNPMPQMPRRDTFPSWPRGPAASSASSSTTMGRECRARPRRTCFPLSGVRPAPAARASGWSLPANWCSPMAAPSRSSKSPVPARSSALKSPTAPPPCRPPEPPEKPAPRQAREIIISAGIDMVSGPWKTRFVEFTI